MQGTTAVIICKKMNSISNAVRRDLTDGMSGMDEFSGYLSALVDVGMIDASEQRMFNEELYRQIIGRKEGDGGMKFVTIQDYGNYSVVEPYDSASTNSVTAQTAKREAKNRHIKAEREATLSAITGGMLTVAAAITMILHWIIIGY